MHIFFSRRAKCVHEHTSALPFLHTNHNWSLPAEQGLTPHSHHTRNKCTLIIPYPMPLEVFYQTQIIILPCMYFGCFHGNQRCVASCHYLYTWEVLQEVDIISTVRPCCQCVSMKVLCVPLRKLSMCLQDGCQCASKKAVSVPPWKWLQEGCQCSSKKAVNVSTPFSIPFSDPVPLLVKQAVSVPPRNCLHESCQCVSKKAVNVSLRKLSMCL